MLILLSLCVPSLSNPLLLPVVLIPIFMSFNFYIVIYWVLQGPSDWPQVWNYPAEPGGHNSGYISEDDDNLLLRIPQFFGRKAHEVKYCVGPLSATTALMMEWLLWLEWLFRPEDNILQPFSLSLVIPSSMIVPEPKVDNECSIQDWAFSCFLTLNPLNSQGSLHSLLFLVKGSFSS